MVGTQNIKGQALEEQTQLVSGNFVERCVAKCQRRNLPSVLSVGIWPQPFQ